MGLSGTSLLGHVWEPVELHAEIARRQQDPLPGAVVDHDAVGQWLRAGWKQIMSIAAMRLSFFV